MSWSWRYESDDGHTTLGVSESFSSQSDAESWLGQSWRELVSKSVVSVVLLEDDRMEYRMSLLQAGE